MTRFWAAAGAAKASATPSSKDCGPQRRSRETMDTVMTESPLLSIVCVAFGVASLSAPSPFPGLFFDRFS
jgi:hypothetical protein